MTTKLLYCQCLLNSEAVFPFNLFGLLQIYQVPFFSGKILTIMVFGEEKKFVFVKLVFFWSNFFICKICIFYKGDNFNHRWSILVSSFVEHVWQVNMQKKGLGERKNIHGPYRLCLTDSAVTFYKVGANNKSDFIEFPVSFHLKLQLNFFSKKVFQLN